MNVSSSIRTMKVNNKNVVNINQKIGNNMSMSLFFSPLCATPTPTNISVMTTSSKIRRGIVEDKHVIAAKREMTWTKAYICPTSGNTSLNNSNNNNYTTPVVMASTASLSEGVLMTYDTNADREVSVDNWHSKTMWRQRSYETVKMGEPCPSQQAAAARDGTNVAFTPTQSSPGYEEQEHHHEQKQPSAVNRSTSSFDIPGRRRRQSVPQQKYQKYQVKRAPATCTDDDEDDGAPRTLPLRHSLMDRGFCSWKATDDDNEDDAPRKIPLRHSLMDRGVHSWKRQRIPSSTASTPAVDSATVVDSRSAEDFTPVIVRSTPQQQRITSSSSSSSSRKRKAEVQLHKEDAANEDVDEEQLHHKGDGTMLCSSSRKRRRC